jgi:hypothetical protein
MHLIHLLCIAFIFTFLSSVAAIIGHLSFFLKKDSSPTFEQAARIYQQSTSDFSVKQAVEDLFKGFHPVNDGILNPSRMLAEEAIKIALNNCSCTISYLFIFIFDLVLIKNVAMK